MDYTGKILPHFLFTYFCPNFLWGELELGYVYVNKRYTKFCISQYSLFYIYCILYTHIHINRSVIVCTKYFFSQLLEKYEQEANAVSEIPCNVT